MSNLINRPKTVNNDLRSCDCIRCLFHLFICFEIMLLYRIGDFKLLAGNTGLYNGWYPPDKMYTEDAHYFEERLKAGKESYYKLFNLKG